MPLSRGSSAALSLAHIQTFLSHKIGKSSQHNLEWNEITAENKFKIRL